MRAPEIVRPRALRAWCSQERFMTAALHDLQTRLDHWHREASYRRTQQALDADESLERCSELEHAYDDLAAQLARVRLTLHGVEEDRRRA